MGSLVRGGLGCRRRGNRGDNWLIFVDDNMQAVIVIGVVRKRGTGGRR